MPSERRLVRHGGRWVLEGGGGPDEVLVVRGSQGASPAAPAEQVSEGQPCLLQLNDGRTLAVRLYRVTTPDGFAYHRIILR
jgi:hypothetical protein